MADLDSLINAVKRKMGELVQRPKMTDRVLRRPPFRFLHDTITAVSTTTGFGVGLYQGEELDSAAITDKQAKKNYLDKIFRLVGICQGKSIDVRSAKVVAGLEPECTNVFLLALAESAADSSIDSPEAVRMCLAGEEPGAVAPPRKGGRGKAESKSGGGGGDAKPARDRGGEADAKSGGGGGGGAKATASDAKISASVPAVSDAMEDASAVPRERSQSRGGTRAGRPTQQSTESGLGGITSRAQVPNLDGEVEKCDGSDATTQALLGAIITRPKLTEKLLSKPPFRFLFDIVVEVTKVTGFAEGLYSADELDPANIGDKNQKLSFLEKIIKLVGVQLNTMVAAKPMRIIGGFDAQDTNNFLQLLAVAARHAPDSRDAVRSVLELGGDFTGAAPAAAPAARAEDKTPAAAAPAQAKSAAAGAAGSKPVEDRRELVREEQPAASDDGGDGGDEMKRSARPTTARRRPPKVKEGAKEVTGRDTAPAGKKAQGIMIDGQGDDDDDEDAVPEEKRLADEVKAEAKTGAAGGPQSKLVQDILGRQAEQEAARKSGTAPADAAADEAKGDDASGGGIRLGKLRKTGADKGKSAPGAAAGPGNFNDGDMERLRGAIQVLVQHTGPLGTCMDYVQEDISLMAAELQRWEEECRRHEGDVESEKRRSRDILQPLQVELAEALPLARSLSHQSLPLPLRRRRWSWRSSTSSCWNKRRVFRPQKRRLPGTTTASNRSSRSSPRR